MKAEHRFWIQIQKIMYCIVSHTACRTFPHVAVSLGLKLILSLKDRQEGAYDCIQSPPLNAIQNNMSNLN